MLPSSGYFKNIPCPFLSNGFGFCERPHCHYKHEKKESSVASSSLQAYSALGLNSEGTADDFISFRSTEPTYDNKSDLLQYYSDAIRKLQDELNKQNEIIENSGPSMATYIPTPVTKTNIVPIIPEKTVPDIPQYNPTPISELNKAKKSYSSEKQEYDPTEVFCQSAKRKRPVEEYDPTKVLPKRLKGADDQLLPKTNLAFSDDEKMPDDEADGMDSGAMFSDDDDDNNVIPVNNKPKTVSETASKVAAKPVSPESSILDEFDVVNKILTESKLTDKQSLFSEASSKAIKPNSNKISSSVSKSNGAKLSVNKLAAKSKNLKSQSEKKVISEKDGTVSKSTKTVENISDKENKKNVSSVTYEKLKTNNKVNNDLTTNNLDSKCDSDVKTTKVIVQSSDMKEVNSELNAIALANQSFTPGKSESNVGASGKSESNVGASGKSESNVGASEQSSSASVKESSKPVKLEMWSGAKAEKSERTSSKHGAKSGSRSKEKHSRSRHSSSKNKSSKDSKSSSGSAKHERSKSSDSKKVSSSRSDKKESSRSSSSDKHKTSKHISKGKNHSTGNSKSSKTSKSVDSKSKNKSRHSDKNSHKNTKHALHSVKESGSSKQSSGKTENSKSPKKCVPKTTDLDNTSPNTKQLELSDIDALLEELDSDLDDHDTEEECWRIFNEEQTPIPTTSVIDVLPKKVKPVETSQETPQLAPVKKRLAHQADLIKPNKSPPRKIMAPAMTLHLRYQKLQEMYLKTREEQLKKQEATPTPSFVSKTSDRKRISHVPNAALIAAAASRKLNTFNGSNSISAVNNKVEVAQTIAVTNPKGSKRVAHVPSAVKCARPMLPLQVGNKVPLVIRQKYLKVFIDECLKFYSTESEAYQRGLQEEDDTYKRSMNRTVYLNVAANAIKKLREEANSAPPEEVETKTILTQKKPVSHESMLGGARAAKTSFSIERNRSKPAKENILKGELLYSLLKPYFLTKQQLEENGYPFPNPACQGKAVFKVLDQAKKGNVHNPCQKTCRRCQALYIVDKYGIYVKMEECVYHWGRLWKRKISGSWESRYSCCQGDSESEGCCVALGHVHEEFDPDKVTGFVQTFEKPLQPDKSYGVYALDCEMCYTTQGIELSRITVINEELRSCYEALVKPENLILDHNTRFSGITEEDLLGVTTTLRDVQAVLLNMFNSKTILIGHSLESDLRALKLIHYTVVDTSIVFPHKNGPPFKRALRTLMAENLQKIIQNGVEGHDSQEDALACMELMLWKLKEDLKSVR